VMLMRPTVRCSHMTLDVTNHHHGHLLLSRVPLHDAMLIPQIQSLE